MCSARNVPGLAGNDLSGPVDNDLPGLPAPDPSSGGCSAFSEGAAMRSSSVPGLEDNDPPGSPALHNLGTHACCTTPSWILTLARVQAWAPGVRVVVSWLGVPTPTSPRSPVEGDGCREQVPNDGPTWVRMPVPPFEGRRVTHPTVRGISQRQGSSDRRGLRRKGQRTSGLCTYTS